MSLTVPAACETQLANKGRDARLAVMIDLLASMAGVNQSASAKTGTDGVGAIFTSADASGADAAITGAPTAGSKLVIDSVEVSVGAAISILFKEETSGTVIAGPYYMAANSTRTFILNRQLPTADKKLMIRTSAAGNVMALSNYHSNP